MAIDARLFRPRAVARTPPLEAILGPLASLPAVYQVTARVGDDVVEVADEEGDAKAHRLSALNLTATRSRCHQRQIVGG